MTFSEYTYLKQQVVISVCSTEGNEHLLIALKELFRDIINSPRRFEQINTVHQLLQILEVRDALSEGNVEPLKLIVRRLPNNANLMKRILDYQNSEVSKKHVNIYTAQNKERPVINNNRQPVQPIIHTNPYGAVMSDIKTQRIHNTLAEEIGIYWKELGRNLKIAESKLDEIDSQKCKTETKAKQLMKFYLEKKADPQRWFFVVCEALDKTRRRDVSRSLQDIMTMNI